MTREEIMRRIRLEPRGQYTHGSHAWLVAYDKDLGRYIQEGRAYKTFKDSDEAYEWIENNY